jgi:Kef-type K+ transport system membrane component KefB
MASAHDASFLQPILMFCAGAVVAVPLFKRLGLGAVVGYLAAGLAIGPSGFGLFNDAATVSGVAELGIVLLLFVIGLELKLSRLLAMRRDIFGLGAAQFAGTAALIALAAVPLGLAWGGAVVLGIALAMSATAIALQILDERPTGSAPSRCCCSRTWPSCPSSPSSRCWRPGGRRAARPPARWRRWAWRWARWRPSCWPGATC